MSKSPLITAIIRALEQANEGSKYQPLSASMVQEFGEVIHTHLRDLLTQQLKPFTSHDAAMTWIKITGEGICACSQLHDCETCKPFCSCDEDGLCSVCAAKGNLTATQILDHFGAPPKRSVAELTSFPDQIRIAKKCPDCKLVPKGGFIDTQFCRGHRALWDSEVLDVNLHQEQCDHEPDPDEGNHCLNCGKDCSEDVMAAAYDAAKDARKYGDT